MSLVQARKLAQEMIEVESLIQDKEEELKELKDRLRRIAEVDLPELMDASELANFTLKDGRKVEMDRSIHASITEANRESAFAWLRESGHGGIIKRAVTMSFPKGESENADKLGAWLKKRYPDYDIKDAESVHPQTLKAFVREMMEEGVELPDSISTFTRTVAVIKHDKKTAAATKKAAKSSSKKTGGKDNLW